ncbi:hypothetical protein GCM10023322_78980 [Rugosimonospora acidiphila]|uniref:Peptidase C39-like domain-containing protein n=1 Tax=Rugosimonospora acidiphila TaxID=556531 RepID=A0ABP9ST11_9ACTN
MNPQNLGKHFKHAVPSRAHRIALVWATMLGVALLIALPLSLGKRSTAPGTAQAISLANAAGTINSSGNAGAEIAAPASAASSPAAPSPAAPSPTHASTVPAAPKVVKAPAKPVAPAAKDLKFDFEYQINGYYCGPASTRMAASTKIAAPSQDTIAMAMGTTTAGTNSAADTTAELNRLEGTSFYHTTFIPGSSATSAEMDQLQANVVHAISNGYGVVANIVGSAQDLSGGYHEYDGGHYIAVIGYSDNGRDVHIADPAGEGADTYWMTTIDLANWMGTRGYSS